MEEKNWSGCLNTHMHIHTNTHACFFSKQDHQLHTITYNRNDENSLNIFSGESKAQ
jgi:hypothetical protein